MVSLACWSAEVASIGTGDDAHGHGGLGEQKGGGHGNPRAPAVPNRGEGGTVPARHGDSQPGGCFTPFLQGAALEVRGEKLPGATGQNEELQLVRWSTGVRGREREGQGRGNLAEFGQIELELEFIPRVSANCSTQCVNRIFIFIFETFDVY